MADEDYLYVAWKITDNTRQSGGSGGCGSYHDDAMDIYIDWNNDKSSSYDLDDVQLEFWSDLIGVIDDPEFLDVGWVSGGQCIFTGPTMDFDTGDPITMGIVEELEDTDEFGEPIPGWQGEIAIALRNIENGKDWDIIPEDGTVIGDGIQILERQFTGRAAYGSDCEDTGDVDDSGTLTIGDAIWLFNYLFLEGQGPALPFPGCGSDPTPDDGFDCRAYPSQHCP